MFAKRGLPCPLSGRPWAAAVVAEERERRGGDGERGEGAASAAAGVGAAAEDHF